MKEVKRYGVSILPREFLGKSTDEKPESEDMPVGSLVLETDTGNVFTWDGEEWVEI